MFFYRSAVAFASEGRGKVGSSAMIDSNGSEPLEDRSRDEVQIPHGPPPDLWDWLDWLDPSEALLPDEVPTDREE